MKEKEEERKKNEADDERLREEAILLRESAKTRRGREIVASELLSPATLLHEVSKLISSVSWFRTWIG